MRKTAVSITAAMFAMTALSTPARADADAIRLGVGIGAMIIGEIAKGAGKGGNKRKPEGRVERRQKPQSGQRDRNRTKTTKTAAGAATAAAVALALPEVGPLPEAKPTAEQMTAWLADAPNRAQAEVEAAEGVALAEAIDPATTAATTAEAETATVDMVDEQNRNWGKLTPTDAKKAWDMVALGMTPSQAFEAFPSLSAPVAETAKAERDSYDLIDDDGRLWGSVSKETSDKVWKAVDLGMTREQAFAALSGLPHPDEAKEAEPAAVVEAKEAAPIVEAEKPAEAVTVTEPVATVDEMDVTAAVEPTPEVKAEQIEKKPAEKAKPKLDIDL